MRNREQRRAARKKAKKEDLPDPEFQEALNAFSDAPTECLMCQEQFDNTDKEQVNTWYIVVRNYESETNLYCPICWDLGKKAATEEMNKEKK